MTLFEAAERVLWANIATSITPNYTQGIGVYNIINLQSVCNVRFVFAMTFKKYLVSFCCIQGQMIYQKPIINQFKLSIYDSWNQLVQHRICEKQRY